MLSKRKPNALAVPQKTVLTEVDVSKHSGRVRLKPLEFWNFERVEVNRTDDGKLQVIHYKQDFPSPKQRKRGTRASVQLKQTFVRRKPSKRSVTLSSHSCTPSKSPQSSIGNGTLVGGRLVLKEEETSASLLPKNSSNLCNKLSTMAIEDIEKQTKALFPFLRRVIEGQESNKRHTVFLRGGRELREMTSELIYHPYSEDQILYIIDFLIEQFSSHIQRLYGKSSVNKYIWKVLAPTLLIRIVMEKENLTCLEAEQLLIKTSLGCTL